jgi:hypothetical protein
MSDSFVGEHFGLKFRALFTKAFVLHRSDKPYLDVIGLGPNWALGMEMPDGGVFVFSIYYNHLPILFLKKQQPRG